MCVFNMKKTWRLVGLEMGIEAYKGYEVGYNTMGRKKVGKYIRRIRVGDIQPQSYFINPQGIVLPEGFLPEI